MGNQKKSKRINITLTEDQHTRARFLSTEVLGQENISGLFSFLIKNYEREKKIFKNFR